MREKIFNKVYNSYIPPIGIGLSGKEEKTKEILPSTSFD
jgi:hypothetical protein